MKKTSVSSTRQRTPFDQVPPNAPSVVVGLKKGAIFFYPSAFRRKTELGCSRSASMLMYQISEHRCPPTFIILLLSDNGSILAESS